MDFFREMQHKPYSSRNTCLALYFFFCIYVLVIMELFRGDLSDGVGWGSFAYSLELLIDAFRSQMYKLLLLVWLWQRQFDLSA